MVSFLEAESQSFYCLIYLKKICTESILLYIPFIHTINYTLLQYPHEKSINC